MLRSCIRLSGIFWEGWINEAKLASAYTRAYNRWIIDFCSDQPKRLFPIAHISAP